MLQCYLNVDQLASYIDSTPAGVRQMVYLKQVPYLKRGRRLLFDRLRIDRWLQQQSFEPAAIETL